MHILFLFAYWILSGASVSATDLYSRSSIDQLILHETREIQVAEMNEAYDLPLKYINRAESYIVAAKFEKAIEDLEKGYIMAYQRKQRNIEQRALIDMMVTHAYLGDDEKALSASEHFQNLFYFSSNYKSKYGCLCKDENYVSGPDEEPAAGWCRQTVEVTADHLVNLVKRSSLRKTTQDSIIFSIGQLESSGLKCCARGERWKGCVGPLAKKSLEWQASGVPADPKWD